MESLGKSPLTRRTSGTYQDLDSAEDHLYTFVIDTLGYLTHVIKKGIDRLAIEVMCRMDISVVRTPSRLDYFVTGIKTGPGALQCYRWTDIPDRFIVDQLLDELLSYILDDRVRFQRREQSASVSRLCTSTGPNLDDERFLFPRNGMHHYT